MLSRLIYISERSFGCPDVAVDRIVALSAERNGLRGVTGFLLADQQFFAQALEGDRAVLTRLFEHISMDNRHDRVVLASMEEIAVPHFPKWGMAHVGDAAAIRAAAEVRGQVFEPYAMTAAALFGLISRVAADAPGATRAA